MMLPPATRVYLACGFTDMRRYVECSIMRSLGPACSTGAVRAAVRSA